MVGCGLLMLAIAWVGTWLSFGEGLLKARLFLVATSLSFPLGFVATITAVTPPKWGASPGPSTAS